MAYRLIWSPETEDALDGIITYLHQNWYVSDITNFLKKFTETLDLVERNPYLFRHSVKQRIHEVDEKKKAIHLLTIIDTRSNPKIKAKTINRIKP